MASDSGTGDDEDSETPEVSREDGDSAELHSADRSSGSRRERSEGLDEANDDAVSGQRPGEEAVDDELFWRDEVLEAMYWMIGEGIEEAVAPSDLRGFLDAPAGVVERTFDDLKARDHLRGTSRGYVFTEHGEGEAKRRFADEFADVQGFTASHTDCGPDCWCHEPDHAEDECPSEHDHQHAHH